MTGGVGSRSCSCCTPASAGRTCRPSWGWLRDDLLATVAPVDRGRDLRPAPPDPAGRAQRRRGDRLVSGGRRRSPPAGQQGGAGVGPSPVDRARPGSKHHLSCDGGGIPLKVLTTGGNGTDVSTALDLVEGIPPVAGGQVGPAAARTPCSRTTATTATEAAANVPGAASSRSSPPAAPLACGGWASCATSSSRPSPCSTSSHAAPFASNATSTCTRPWSPWPAPSSAGDDSRTEEQDRVRSS